MSIIESNYLNSNIGAEFKKDNKALDFNEEENYFLSEENNAAVCASLNSEETDENSTEEEKFNLKTFFSEAISKIKDFFGIKKTKEDSSYDINGRIDKDFRQGNTGDCALLSALYSVSTTQQGQKIIEEAITVNEGLFGQVKSYDVYFKGIDETVTITKKELEKAEEIARIQKGSYSDGDDDVLLLELAWEKCTQQAQDKLKTLHFTYSYFGSGTNGLDGVDQLKFLYSLTGAQCRNVHYDYQYSKLQGREKAPEILEVFENQTEFNFKEIAGIKEEDSEYAFRYCGFEFNQKDVYEIIQKPSETQDNTITIRNKTTNEEATFEAQDLAETLGSVHMTQETKDACFEAGYSAALDATFLTVSSPSYLGEPPEYYMNDINGESVKIIFTHAYAVKSIDEEKIV
ncbi:MAG: hypothetical protein IKL52_03670, partial [Candidatus Gastranaerophilales bacterium]|nr:hypothetical protein [Candidatus Gastranaerophilales bacterium]